MELIYDLEGAGWAGARISDGSRHCYFSVSYLSDALGDMAKAAVMLLHGSREESFSLQDEPGEHRFILIRGDSDSLTIRVLRFEGTRANRFGKEVFCCECAVRDFVGRCSPSCGPSSPRMAWTAISRRGVITSSPSALSKRFSAVSSHPMRARTTSFNASRGLEESVARHRRGSRCRAPRRS